MTVMKRRTAIRTSAWGLVVMIFALLAVFLTPANVWAHGGEDHSHDSKSVVQTGTNPRVTATSEAFEIVATPSPAGNGKLSVYLTDFWSNKWISKAAIEITQGDLTVKATEKSGVYELDAPWVKAPGQYGLTFSVTAGDVSDLLIGTLTIPPAVPGSAQHNSLWDHVRPALPLLPMAPGWQLAAALCVTLLAGIVSLRTAGGGHRIALILTAVAGLSSVTLAAAVLAGEKLIAKSSNPGSALFDIPDISRRAEDGSVFVPKSTQRLLQVSTLRTAKATTAQKTVRLIGQVIPDPNKSGLVQALLAGRIEPPEGGFPSIGSRVKAGDTLGFLVPSVQLVDQSDIRQTTGDLDRQIALAEAKLARIEPLRGRAVPEAQVIDARIELDALKKRRASIKPVAEREALRAPADGVIAQANIASGQVVEAQALLFQIVEPDSLWVEAFAFDNSAASGIEKIAKDAIATTADGRRIELIFEGRALTMRQQAVPLRFAIKGNAPGLSIGEPVTVHAPVDQLIEAIPLLRSSVVRSANGQSMVWMHTGPERFEARVVASEPIDADRIGVTAGLEPDARVVVRGAELISQVR